MNDDGMQPLRADDPMSPGDDPYIGTSIDGRYLVESILGEGGMGVVYAARHKVIDKRVAIKILRASMAQKQDITDRFLQEAKTASSIGNPHIVDVSDFGTLADGSTYLVMEHVPGKTLTRLLAEVRPFPLARAITITKQIATGLSAAHEIGIVHRDLKPDNIMVVHRSPPGLTGSGRDFVKILDFGIAKVMGTVTGQTRQGAIFGTPHYMSPEQASGTSVDRRTDIYALGVILYEMGCGERPFDAENFMALLNKHIRTPVVPLLSRPHPPDVPPAFDALVGKCLAKRADDRYASMDELLVDLERLELGEPVGSNRRSPVSAPGPASNDASIPDLLIPDLAPRPSVAKAAPPAPPAAKPRAQRVAPMGIDDDPFEDAGGSLKLELDAPMSGSHAPMLNDYGGRSSGISAASSRSSRAGSLDGRGGRDEPAQRARPARARGLRTGLALFAVTVASVIFGAPVLLKSMVAASAVRRGLVLDVERVEVRTSGLTLLGITVSPASLPACTLKAREADVTMDWQANVQKVSIPGYELNVRGNAIDVGERFAAWRQSAHVPTALDAKAGHVLWSDVLGPKVDADALGVAITVAGDEEAALHVTASSLSLTLPRGQLGPWQAEVDSSGAETKVVIALDRDKPTTPPSVTLTSRPDLGRVLSVVIPRATLPAIGIPSEPWHLPRDVEAQVTFEGQVLPTGQPVNAKTKVTLFKWPVAGGSPTDLTVEGRVSGESTEPLRIDDAFVTVGKTSTSVSGTAVVAPDGVRVQFERGRGKAAASPPVVFDTREWTNGTR